MAEYFINRHREKEEVLFKYGVGPKNGKCQKCGKCIEAYDSYFIDRNTGDMYCPGECADSARWLFMLEHGFYYYTDG